MAKSDAGPPAPGEPGQRDKPPTRLRRQIPGSMGLGTNQSAYIPPPDWKLPPKPDPMTTGHVKRRSR